MDDASSFGDFLKARAVLLGLVGEDGHASAQRVADRLTAGGIPVKVRTVESWFWNERAPRIGRMELILDELSVHGDLRALAYKLAARVDLDDPPPILDEDGAVVVPCAEASSLHGLDSPSEGPSLG